MQDRQKAKNALNPDGEAFVKEKSHLKLEVSTNTISDLSLPLGKGAHTIQNGLSGVIESVKALLGNLVVRGIGLQISSKRAL